MARPLLRYLLPPIALTAWGGAFLYLAASGRLRLLLHPLFWPVEIGGGIALLFLAVAYLVFFRPATAGRPDDAVSTRKFFGQSAVLVIPILLATFLSPPSLSAAALERRAGLSGGRVLAQSGAPAAGTDQPLLVDFAAAAYYPEHIPEMTGRKVRYLGQYLPGHHDGEFRFCRSLMSCCVADVTPIYVNVVGASPVYPEMSWITVEGETYFRKDDDEWVPCLHVTRVTPDQAPPDPYLYAVRMKAAGS